MKKKTMKNYIYEGLGFSVELHDIEMIEIEGEWHPKIDVRKIAASTIKSLVRQENRLTGNQVKFVRDYFSMSLREFAKVVNESHTAVSKWEKMKNKSTNMDINIEIMLRLYIYDKTTAVVSHHKRIEFYNQYKKVTSLFCS